MSLQILNTPLVSDPNLVAYYKLEDVNDSKNSFHLTNNNSVPFNAAKFGNGANFGIANTNKSLNVANNLGINGNSISVSFWVKLNTEISAGIYGMFEQVNSASGVANKVRYLYNAGSPLLQFIRVKLGVQEQSVNYQVSLGTNIFHHIVFTYDGTNTRGYLDGVLVAGPTAMSGSGSGGGNFFMLGANDQGQATYTPDSFASAILDDVAVFSRMLTAVEINNIYIGNLGGGAFFAGFV